MKLMKHYTNDAHHSLTSFIQMLIVLNKMGDMPCDVPLRTWIWVTLIGFLYHNSVHFCVQRAMVRGVREMYRAFHYHYHYHYHVRPHTATRQHHQRTLAQGYNPSTHDRNDPLPRNVAILEAMLLFFSFTWCVVGVIFITESKT